MEEKKKAEEKKLIKAVTIYLDVPLYKRIFAKAKADKRALSNYITMLLEKIIIGE